MQDVIGIRYHADHAVFIMKDLDDERQFIAMKKFKE
jgi:hypothetical protein